MPFSLALPAELGARRIFTSVFSADCRALTWLVHHQDIAVLPVANRVCSTGALMSSVAMLAGGAAPLLRRFSTFWKKDVAVASLKPSPPSAEYSDSPCCMAQVFRSESVSE